MVRATGMLERDVARRALWRIRAAHTVVWAVFASATIAIPFAVLADRLNVALWLSLLVWAEALVLVVNGWRCPLNTLAARYTENRSGNFDIFLPAWLATHTKAIFGSIFAAGQILLVSRLL